VRRVVVSVLSVSQHDVEMLKAAFDILKQDSRLLAKLGDAREVVVDMPPGMGEELLSLQ
jgi:hypothetical protein